MDIRIRKVPLVKYPEYSITAKKGWDENFKIWKLTKKSKILISKNNPGWIALFHWFFFFSVKKKKNPNEIMSFRHRGTHTYTPYAISKKSLSFLSFWGRNSKMRLLWLALLPLTKMHICFWAYTERLTVWGAEDGGVMAFFFLNSRIFPH